MCGTVSLIRHTPSCRGAFAQEQKKNVMCFNNIFTSTVEMCLERKKWMTVSNLVKEPKQLFSAHLSRRTIFAVTIISFLNLR
jgi:hypothetical protein